jgi:hypothetical protein
MFHRGHHAPGTGQFKNAWVTFGEHGWRAPKVKVDLLADIMADVERNVLESENRCVLYLDLLGFAALTEANPHYFMSEPAPSWQTWPTNPAVYRLSVFHQVLESNISSEQPNYAMVFSDCAFVVFYTPTACAEFAISLMQGFLRVKVPVRMGLGYGTFRAIGANTSFLENSTVVRAMFGGTSVVRAVEAESCGGKGMRIFSHSSFSEVFDGVRNANHPRRKRIEIPLRLKSVSRELDYVSNADPENVDEWVANIQKMAATAAATVQPHYSETLAALSRMLGYDVEDVPGPED